LQGKRHECNNKAPERKNGEGGGKSFRFILVKTRGIDIKEERSGRPACWHTTATQILNEN